MSACRSDELQERPTIVIIAGSNAETSPGTAPLMGVVLVIASQFIFLISLDFRDALLDCVLLLSFFELYYMQGYLKY